MADIEEVSSRIPFLINFIVTRMDIYKIDDPIFAVVNVKFNNVPLNITQSRINVDEFNSKRAFVVMESPEVLRRNLESESPLVSVKYKGGTIGSGVFTFPQYIIDRIKKGMSDIYHSDTVRIDRRGVDMGTLELLCFMTIKCEEVEVLQTCNRCSNLGKSINPTDMMFVVGAPQPCQAVCEPCEDDLVPEEGDKMLDLDLSRYTKQNQRVTTPPISSQTACSNLKAITKQYSDIIDSFVRKVKSMPTTRVSDRILKKDFSKKREYASQEYVDRSMRVPLGDMEHMGIKPIRFCPVCLTSMSYQPKYARCPNCLNKAMPDIDSMSKENPTADQIIDEFIKPDQGNEQPSTEEKRCCCQGGEQCTHCRVREVFANVCDPTRRSKQTCPTVNPSQNDDFCIRVHRKSPNDSCKPYLEHVLDELRNLYKERDDDMPSESGSRLSRFVAGKADLEKFKRESVGPKAIGTPSFMHRVPNHPKIGHKTCMDRAATVPRRHGWAWMSTKAAKYGWRPGAISRSTGFIMRFFLNSREQNKIGICQNIEEEANRTQPVILNICKKNGAIYLTLNAVRNPHIEIKPIVFKIVKSDLAVALRQIKKKLKSMGFRKCVCHNSVMLCVCRDLLEKKHLERALQKECNRRKMVNCVDQLVLTDTSESEIEYNLDVTPPIPDSKPLLAIKPCTKTMGTQIEPTDLTPLPCCEVPLDPYWYSYDCALGSRKPTDMALAYIEAANSNKAANGNKLAHGNKPANSFNTANGSKAGNGKSGPIPVRMLKRYYEKVKETAHAEKEAAKAEMAKKKKGIDLMKYLRDDGTVPHPWNPNDPHPSIKPKVTSRRRDFTFPPEEKSRYKKHFKACAQDFPTCMQRCGPCYCYC